MSLHPYIGVVRKIIPMLWREYGIKEEEFLLLNVYQIRMLLDFILDPKKEKSDEEYEQILQRELEYRRWLWKNEKKVLFNFGKINNFGSFGIGGHNGR